jgi:hypothetical protein
LKRRHRLLLGLALLAGCAQDPAATGSGAADGSRALGASEAPKDPLWGNIVIPSPSPGDTNPLKIMVVGNEVHYTVQTEGPKVMTYITRRVEDKDDLVHKDEFLHMESDDPVSHYEVVLSYKRFYHGHYSVTAFADNNSAAIGERTFSIE